MKRCSRVFVALVLALSATMLLEILFLIAGFTGVYVSRTSFDAGRMQPGQVSHYSVRLYNFAPWEVTFDALPKCGCTVTDNGPRTVSPFHAVTIPISLTASLRNRGHIVTDVPIVYLMRGHSFVRDVWISYDDNS